MFSCPKKLHKIHKFQWSERYYVADLDCGQVLEIDKLLWEILDLVSSCETDQIVEQLRSNHAVADILEALKVLEETEKRGLLFDESKPGFPTSTREKGKGKPRILIPQGQSAWFSDIRLIAAGTQVALYHMATTLAKYADVYIVGESEKQIEEGIYEIPLNRPGIKWEDFYGILTYHSELSLELLNLFRFANAPILIQIHAPRGHAGKEINSILLYYSAMRNFDAFTAASASVGAFYSQLVPDISCFYILPNGVDADWFQPMDKQVAKAEIARMVNDSRVVEKPVVGFLSRFQPEKGASIYIKIAQMNPESIFLVGAHSLRHYRLRELPKNLIYAGFQPREKLPLLYNAFDVYCFPSMAAEETFGLTVLEAMACGVPPVVPNFDGVPGVVGDAGIIVDSENFSHDIGSFASYVSATALSEGIQYLLNHPTERLNLGKKARERALSFTWDKTAQKILEIFEELNQKKRSHRRHNFSVLFTPYVSQPEGDLKYRSLLLNATNRQERPLMRSAYPQTVETGLALSLMKSHSFREVQVLLDHLTQDENITCEILKRAKGFIEATS